jgi:hypothetical protein
MGGATDRVDRLVKPVSPISAHEKALEVFTFANKIGSSAHRSHLETGG